MTPDDKKAKDNSAEQDDKTKSQSKQGAFSKKKQSIAPLTSLKFLDPKQIQNTEGIDTLSKVSDFSDNDPEQADNVSKTGSQRRALAQSVVASSL